MINLLVGILLGASGAGLIFGLKSGALGRFHFHKWVNPQARGEYDSITGPRTIAVWSCAMDGCHRTQRGTVQGTL